MIIRKIIKLFRCKNNNFHTITHPSLYYYTTIITFFLSKINKKVLFIQKILYNIHKDR